MTEQNHGDGEAKSAAKHKNRKIQAEVVSWLRRRTRMEILAYGIATLATLILAVVSILYNTHKIPMIKLFGIAVLLYDVAVCVFWISKVQDAAQPLTAQAAAVGASSSPEPVPSEPSGRPEPIPSTKPPGMALPPSPPIDHQQPPQGNNAMPNKKPNNSSNENASQQPLISQSMVNSPHGHQSIGNVIINQAPPQRSFTTEQRNLLISRLRQWPPLSFEILATIGDAEAQIFAEELYNLLSQAGWTPQYRAGQFIPTGDRPVGMILTVRDQTTAKGAAVFQSLVESFGFHAPGKLDSNFPPDRVQIIVGHSK